MHLSISDGILTRGRLTVIRCGTISRSIYLPDQVNRRDLRLSDIVVLIVVVVVDQI